MALLARTKILIMDEQALFRDSIRALLCLYSDFEVVGEAQSRDESIVKTTKLMPDVVLMARIISAVDRLKTMRHIRKAIPTAKILVLSESINQKDVLQSIKAGASGYLTTRIDGPELVGAIRAVQDDGCYLSAEAAQALMETYRRRKVIEPFELLTPKQRQMLKLMAEGHTCKTIGQTFNISLRTAQKYRMTIMRKLGIHHQREVIEYAARKGLASLV